MIFITVLPARKIEIMNRAERRRHQRQNNTPGPHLRHSTSTRTDQEQQKKTIGMALQHHSSGRISEAKKLYQRVLNSNPNHIDALHLIGVAFHQEGLNEEAVLHIRNAITQKPDFAEAHCNLGAALIALGKPDQAEISYKKAVAIHDNL